jgi:hypothetical protein
MRQKQNEKSQGFPGVISTLTAGFELTTGHLWLLIFPVMLDSFYWLGPRLSVQGLIEQNAKILGTESTLSSLVEQMVQMAPQINLFTSLSLPLIGVPALMSGGSPETTPIIPSVLEIDSAFTWVLLFVVFSMIGLLLATIYLSLVGWALKSKEEKVRPPAIQLFVSVGQNYLRLIVLLIIGLIMLFFVSLPLLPIAVILGILSGGLFLVVFLVGVLLVITYFSMSVPGIVFNGRPVMLAILESLRMVHRNLLPTLGLLLSIFLISNGMNLLWRIADDGSWLTVVSIVGHAFISTSLIASLFIFYRDRYDAKTKPVEAPER